MRGPAGKTHSTCPPLGDTQGNCLRSLEFLPGHAADLLIDGVELLAREVNRGDIVYSEGLGELMQAALGYIAAPSEQDIYRLEDLLSRALADAAGEMETLDAIQDAIDLAEQERKNKPRTPPTLGCYYNAPETNLAAATARQATALQTHLNTASRWGAAWAEFLQRRAEAFAAAGGADGLTSGQKARITRNVHRAAADAHGFGRRIPPPPATMFSGGQGSGKTSLARAYIAQAGHGQVWALHEPTTEKAKEEYAAYLDEPGEHKPPAMMVLGRGHPDLQRPGHHMCDRHTTAERVAQAGMSVVATMCQSCPLAELCGDRRQRREAQELVDAGNGALFVLASEYLFHQAPIPQRHHVIADESVLITAVETPSFPIDEVRNLHLLGDGEKSDRVRETLNNICDALETPCPPKPEIVALLMKNGAEPLAPQPAALLYLRNIGVTRVNLRETIQTLEDEIVRRTPDFDGSRDDGWIDATLDINERDLSALRHTAGLVAAVLREFDRKRSTLTAVVVREGTDRDGNSVRVILISRQRRLFGLKHSSLTVLDGTGDHDLSRRLFGPRLQHVCIRFPRKLDVTGTRGRRYSRQSFTGADAKRRAMDSRAGSAAKLRNEVAQIFDRLPAGSLFCGQKRVIDSAIESHAIDGGTKVTWFAALRGKNFWEECPGGLFYGTQAISARALEDVARAYLADDDAPFVSIDEPPPDGWGYQQWPCKATRMRRMRDGSQEPVEVEIHPNPTVQAVYEQIREAELMQAIDRLRSIWNHRRIVVMNDLVLDVVYDRTYRHRELVAGGSALERAWQAGGILPRNRDDLRRLYPTIFPTDWAAQQAIRELDCCQRGSGGFLNRNPIWKTTLTTYKTIGPNSPPSHALVDLDRHPDPLAAMTAALGRLSMFNGVPCADATIRAPKRRAPGPFKATLTGPATIIPFPEAAKVAPETIEAIVEDNRQREQAKAQVAAKKAAKIAAREARQAAKEARMAAKEAKRAAKAGHPIPGPLVTWDQSQNALMETAWRTLGSQEVAHLWMTTVNPQLEMRRPADVCRWPNGADACRRALGLRSKTLKPRRSDEGVTVSQVATTL